MLKGLESPLRSLYEQAAQRFEHFQHVRQYRGYIKGESLLRGVYQQMYLAKDLAKPDFIITPTVIQDAARIARVLALYGLNSVLYTHKTYHIVTTSTQFEHTYESVNQTLQDTLHDFTQREAQDGLTTDDLGYAAALSHHATILSWREYGVDPYTDTPYKKD